MVCTCFLPIINKNGLAPAVFFFYEGPISQVICFIYYEVFIGILGESVEIQFVAIIEIDFKKGFSQIWNRVVYFYY